MWDGGWFMGLFSFKHSLTLLLIREDRSTWRYGVWYVRGWERLGGVEWWGGVDVKGKRCKWGYASRGELGGD